MGAVQSDTHTPLSSPGTDVSGENRKCKKGRKKRQQQQLPMPTVQVNDCDFSSGMLSTPDDPSPGTRWKMLPKRRHSIQVVPPARGSGKPDLPDLPSTKEEADTLSPRSGAKIQTRRLSIAESFQHMTKSVSRYSIIATASDYIFNHVFLSVNSSLQKAMHLGSSSTLIDDRMKLNKGVLKEILSTHYNQPDLKVRRLEIAIYIRIIR